MNMTKTKQQWSIISLGTGMPIICDSFQECYEKYFEGFNLPYLMVDGEREKFESAYARVSLYHKTRQWPPSIQDTKQGETK